VLESDVSDYFLIEALWPVNTTGGLRSFIARSYKSTLYLNAQCCKMVQAVKLLFEGLSGHLSHGTESVLIKVFLNFS